MIFFCVCTLLKKNVDECLPSWTTQTILLFYLLTIVQFFFHLNIFFCTKKEWNKIESYVHSYYWSGGYDEWLKNSFIVLFFSSRSLSPFYFKFYFIHTYHYYLCSVQCNLFLLHFYQFLKKMRYCGLVMFVRPSSTCPQHYFCFFFRTWIFTFFRK